MRPEHLPAHLTRRQALIALGVAGFGAAYGVRELSDPGSAESATTCLLQREVTEGPYYLDLDLVRRNIRSGQKGTPLRLDFVVVKASTCAVIPGALVEIWHANAAGDYSGVSGNGGTYLRGGQRSSRTGRVRFDTVVPGWYRGRTPHIHMKVFVGGDEVHTGQVFFRTDTLRRIYAQGAYAARGQADTTNGSDGIYRQAGSRAIVALKRKGSTTASGYTGTMTVGVDV